MLRGASLSLGLACAAAMIPAQAQMARNDLVAATRQPQVSAGPAFRDPKTGQIWTPKNVSQDGKPLDPEDRAFDPRGQATPPGGPFEQYGRVKRVGVVPVTAGPTVPLVEIDNLSLRVQPGAGWRAVLYLQNYSASILAPTLGCTFSNAGRTVEETRASLPTVAGGERIGILVLGPMSQIYTDSVTCRVISP